MRSALSPARNPTIRGDRLHLRSMVPGKPNDKMLHSQIHDRTAEAGLAVTHPIDNRAIVGPQIGHELIFPFNIILRHRYCRI